jgi:uncharacterized membrane protein YkvA (DUF1232 family)
VGVERDNLVETPGEYVPWTGSDGARAEPASSMSWKQRAQQLQKEAHVFYFAFKHPRTPWYAKLAAACTAGYPLSPIQLIPSFIPVIGFLDDFLILFFGAKLLQRIIPADVLAECRQSADVAEKQRNEKITSTTGTVAALAIATVWLLLAVAASGLIAAYISH